MSTRIRFAPLAVIAVLLGAVIGGLLLLPTLAVGEPAPHNTVHGEPALVVRVIDGDTVVVSTEDTDMLTVRIFGVDTPETVHPTKPVACYGPEAAAHLTTLLPTGHPVRLVTDSQQGPQDRYGRELRHLYTGPLTAPVLVAEQLLRGGYGIRYTAAPTDHNTRLEQAERTARTADTGLWGACPSK